MKNILFGLLIFAMLLMFTSILITNIYMLGLAEIIAIPTMILLIRLNLKH